MADLLQAVEQYKVALEQKDANIEALCARKDVCARQLSTWSALAANARLQDVEAQICGMQSQKLSIEHQLQTSCYEQLQYVLYGLRDMSQQDVAWLAALRSAAKATQMEVEEEEAKASDTLRAHLTARSGHAAAMSLLEREIEELEKQAEGWNSRASSLLPSSLSLSTQARALQQEAETIAHTVQATTGKVAILKGRTEDAQREVAALERRIGEAHARTKASQAAASKSEAEAAAIHASCDAAELKRHQEAMNLAANRRAAELSGAAQVVMMQHAAAGSASSHAARQGVQGGGPVPRGAPTAAPAMQGQYQQAKGQHGQGATGGGGPKAWQLPVPPPPPPPHMQAPGPRPPQQMPPARGYGPVQAGAGGGGAYSTSSFSMHDVL